MDKLRAAARQALVALEDVMADFDGSWALADTAMTALREALAEQAEQEPVAWIDNKTWCFTYSQYEYEDLDDDMKDDLVPLYAAPVQQAEQEPVAWWMTNGEFTSNEWEAKADGPDATPLYATPVRTKDLTDAHILVLWQETATPDAHRIERFARAVIAADREKNK